MTNIKNLVSEHEKTGKNQFIVTLENSQEWLDIQEEGWNIQKEGNYNISYGYNVFEFPGKYYITIVKQ